MAALKGALIGTGFFAHMQMQAWQKIAEAQIVSVCDLNLTKAQEFAQRHNISRVYGDIDTLLGVEELDFIDIVTGPDTHCELVAKGAAAGLAVLCQKPLAPSFDEAQRIVQTVKGFRTPFMVNENWRWQQWYREIKQLINNDAVGELFHITVHMRTGDGRGSHPYVSQPYFRSYPRMLIFETGVHFIDTVRMFLGEACSVYAINKRLNPVIQGEDFSLITISFDQGATAIIDANRYTQPTKASEAFAQVTFEGMKGAISLNRDLSIHVQLNNGHFFEHPYEMQDGYKGGSCENAQRHFIETLLSDTVFESNGDDYLRTLAVVEAVYQSAACGERVVPQYPVI